MRPHLGMDKSEYSHPQRLSGCLPALLRAEGIHSAFYTTSNVGHQRKLGFGEVWSSMEDYASANRTHARAGKMVPRKRVKKRMRWPKQWWRLSTAALLRGRSAGQYNWLGDHDFFSLPKARGNPAPLHRAHSSLQRPPYAPTNPARPCSSLAPSAAPY